MSERHAATESTSRNKYDGLYSEAQKYLTTINQYKTANEKDKNKNSDQVRERGATIVKNDKLEAEKKSLQGTIEQWKEMYTAA